MGHRGRCVIQELLLLDRLDSLKLIDTLVGRLVMVMADVGLGVYLLLLVKVLGCPRFGIGAGGQQKWELLFHVFEGVHNFLEQNVALVFSLQMGQGAELAGRVREIGSAGAPCVLSVDSVPDLLVLKLDHLEAVER